MNRWTGFSSEEHAYKLVVDRPRTQPSSSVLFWPFDIFNLSLFFWMSTSTLFIFQIYISGVNFVRCREPHAHIHDPN
jgi:hypothetical protein